jgi:hypothetical protein
MGERRCSMSYVWYLIEESGQLCAICFTPTVDSHLYPSSRRLGGHQSWSEQFREERDNLLLLLLQNQKFSLSSLLTSQFTNYTILAPNLNTCVLEIL